MRKCLLHHVCLAGEHILNDPYLHADIICLRCCGEKGTWGPYVNKVSWGLTSWRGWEGKEGGG